jgi:nucleotide-binding universal stress UspA family protein
MLAVVDTPPALHVAQPRGIQSVLVAFDGSPGAWIALARAIDIAVGQHARLVVAGVVREPSFWFSIGGAVTPFSRESLIRDLEREMQQTLAAARDEIPATVSVTTHLLHGRPAVALAALADAAGSGLIVVGHRRLGRVRRRLSRSVTRGLLASADASVLAVNQP